MKKVFLVYGHYSDKSFNAAIRDTFIETAKQLGHTVDCVDLYKENFDPVFRSFSDWGIHLKNGPEFGNSGPSHKEIFCVRQ